MKKGFLKGFYIGSVRVYGFFASERRFPTAWRVVGVHGFRSSGGSGCVSVY